MSQCFCVREKSFLLYLFLCMSVRVCVCESVSSVLECPVIQLFQHPARHPLRLLNKSQHNLSILFITHTYTSCKGSFMLYVRCTHRQRQSLFSVPYIHFVHISDFESTSGSTIQAKPAKDNEEECGEKIMELAMTSKVSFTVAAKESWWSVFEPTSHLTKSKK